MLIGAQIVAPDGFQQLRRDETHYFLRSDAHRDRILLVRFSGINRYSTTRADIVMLERGPFESALASGDLAAEANVSSLPPWHASIDGENLRSKDLVRTKAKCSHADRVDSRLVGIGPAIHDRSWLDADDPQRALNCVARSQGKNETRFRVQVLAYLLWGRNWGALYPTYHRAGHWERPTDGTFKSGRPSLSAGGKHGCGELTELTKTYIEGFWDYAALGRNMTEIYDLIMLHKLKCRIVRGNTLREKRFIAPAGVRFYTYDQFRYRLIKEVGIPRIQKTLYGEARYRTRCAPSEGHYSQAVSNLMEKVEADGYHVEERPRGYLEGSTLSPLVGVRIADVLSGFGLGIGFSLGAETHEAYRMALFCMAVPKDYFCELFGLRILPEDWPSSGVPSGADFDRGPGASKDLIKDWMHKMPVRGLTPSHSGQSKATVESSNPKKIRIEGAPTYVQSKLTPVALARKEIMKMIRRNHISSVPDRIDAAADMAQVPPTPIGLWNYYDSRMRNDGQPMSKEDAIRTFLTPKELQLKEDGVYLCGRRYISDEFKASDVRSRLMRSPHTVSTIKGYVLTLCVRHLWVELDGKLLKLDAQLRIRGDQEELYVSLPELEQLAEERRKATSRFRAYQRAESAHWIDEFETQTGNSWDSGIRRRGRAKKTSESHREDRDANAKRS